jgi:hypothetical protein
MKMKKYIMPLLGVALTLAACEKPVDFNGEGPSPKLVISTIAGPNRGFKEPYGHYNRPEFGPNTHFVDVREAVFLFGDRKPAPVNDPALKVLVNGAEIPVETTIDDDSFSLPRRYHHFNTPLVEGDRLEISVETPEHGRVTASDVVPAPAVISDLKTEWFIDPEDSGWYLKTLVTIDDPAGEKNYYRFEIRSTVRYRYTGTEWIYNSGTGKQEPVTVEKEYEVTEEHEVLTDHELLFSRTDNFPSAEQWNQVSDEVFNGRSYTFNLYANIPFEPYVSYENELIGHSVTVDVHTLSAAAFKHLRSLDIAADGNYTTEPVKIYSNVEGGYGIFGVYNVASKTVELPLPEKTE